MKKTPTPETYDALQAAYDVFNTSLFGGQLPGALITLQREKRTCGYFSPDRFGNHDRTKADEIAMNPCYFGIRSITDTLSTLAHEMVHQFQQVTGQPGRGRYHNKQWGMMMEAVGLMPSHTGQPGGDKTGDSMSHYIIENGLFENTCKKMLSKDFRLSWYDRFPPLSEIPMDPDSPNPTDIDLEPVTRTKNKIKYTCPTCKTNVWGKPDLNLICGDDDEPFEAQEENDS